MTARRLAQRVVARTFEAGAYTERAFAAEAARARLDRRDHRHAMRLAYGTVQRVRTVDHALETLGGRRPRRLQAPLRNALRVSTYELLFEPGTPAPVAVSEGVSLARSAAGAHTAGLANGVLRRIAEAPAGWLDELPPALRHSYPDWVGEEWERMLGADESEALMRAQNEPPELCVRVNTLRTQDVDLGVAAHRDPRLPEALVLDEPLDLRESEAYRDGRVWPQSRASMLPARVLAPEPGMRVLDLCAAPGGKSGQLAALMEDRGELVCVERHPGRAAELADNLRRLGVTCARVEQADAETFAEDGFDRVLLDPPCSGLGVLARRPDARWRRSLDDARELAELERRLLDHATTLVAPGGALVYSVCTIRRAECEEIVAGGRQTLPHRDGTDGFYVARLGR